MVVGVRSEVFLLARTHRRFLFAAVHVVIPAEVEKTVHEEMFDLRR